MEKEKVVGIDEPVINNNYSGFRERVYYAGMPSPESFSLIYETAYVKLAWVLGHTHKIDEIKKRS